jgi:hypothetical protein
MSDINLVINHHLDATSISNSGLINIQDLTLIANKLFVAFDLDFEDLVLDGCLL